MNIIAMIRALFAPTVNGAVAGLNKALAKVEQAYDYYSAEADRQQDIADAATFASREAKIEAARASRIHARIVDVVS